jgi:hypothetical protein
MILAALILQAATPQTAVDAERAFAAAAQAKGQWTAFREFAAADATMFVPQPVKVQDWLKDRKDPPRSVEWWPTESYLSCDGKLAINTGGWKRPEGTVGYFSTVWRKEAGGGWKWIVDGGDALNAARPRPAKPRIVRAACSPVKDARISVGPSRSEPSNWGKSADSTLEWSWRIDATGKRFFSSHFWDGTAFRTAVFDQIAAPAK